jgi:hypothetical protein
MRVSRSAHRAELTIQNESGLEIRACVCVCALAFGIGGLCLFLLLNQTTMVSVGFFLTCHGLYPTEVGRWTMGRNGRTDRVPGFCDVLEWRPVALTRFDTMTVEPKHVRNLLGWLRLYLDKRARERDGERLEIHGHLCCC